MNSDVKSPVVLEPLVGRELAAVVFVRDYLQLQFDGPTLTLLAWPRVADKGQYHDFEHPEYRNILCGCIGKVVRRAVASDQLRMEFDDGISLSISLRQEDRQTVEIATLTTETGQTWVWR